jgi:heme exporter protein B
MKSLTSVFLRQCQRELLLCKRQPRLMIHAWLFYLMMLLFFPLSLTPSTAILQEVGPGLVWIAALFAVLLLSEGWFQRAYEEGVLEQAWVSGEPVVLVVLATISIQWLIMTTALLIFFPVIVILYHLTSLEGWLLAASFCLGAPALFFITAFAASLNVGRVQRTTLMALLVLPLVVPVMIFGSGVVKLNAMQGAVSGVMALLSACSLLCMGGLPFAITAVLRLRFED